MGSKYRRFQFLNPLSGEEYVDKVLGYSPIAYWPLWEASGSVAHELVNDWDGAYTGVTLGQTGIGDGRTCPLFDGANDYVNIYSLGLQGAFDGCEGTLAAWCKVFNAGVWTNGALGWVMSLPFVDWNNLIALKKSNINNRLEAQRIAGVTATVNTRDGTSPTTWFHLALTWSVAASQQRAYFNGVSFDPKATAGTWVGTTLDNTHNIIGALSTAPAHPWHGYLAHSAIWDTPLTPAQIADLAVV